MSAECVVLCAEGHSIWGGSKETALADCARVDCQYCEEPDNREDRYVHVYKAAEAEGLTGVAACEAEMRDRVADKNKEIARLRALVEAAYLEGVATPYTRAYAANGNPRFAKCWEESASKIRLDL